MYVEDGGHNLRDQVQDRQNGGRWGVLKHNDLRTDVEEAKMLILLHIKA